MTIPPYTPPSWTATAPRGNMLSGSATLSPTYWTPEFSTLAVGSVTGPDGVTLANTLIDTAVTNAHDTYQTFTTVPGQVYTFSCSFKAGSRFARLLIEDVVGVAGWTLIFDAGPGVLSSLTPFNATGKLLGWHIVSQGNGWWRADMTLAAQGTSMLVLAGMADATGNPSFLGDGAHGIYVFGPQVEPGYAAGVYVPTLAGPDLGIWAGVNGLPVLPYLIGQTWDVAKAPTFSTTVVRAASGRERRTSNWPYPLWTFDLNYEVIRHRSSQPELFLMWEFFNAARGKAGTWLFLDPSDNQVSPAYTFAQGDGATTAFTIARPMNSVQEPVYAVYGEAIYVGGTKQTRGVNYNLGTNGAIVFTTPPGNTVPISWTGYFYFGCRFDQDDLSFSQIINTLWSGKSLKFTSLRV